MLWLAKGPSSRSAFHPQRTSGWSAFRQPTLCAFPNYGGQGRAASRQKAEVGCGSDQAARGLGSHSEAKTVERIGLR